MLEIVFIFKQSTIVNSVCVSVSKRMYRWFRMYGALKIHHLSQLCCVWLEKVPGLLRYTKKILQFQLSF